MFEITEKASDKLKELLKEKETVPGIRIVLAQGGWSGPSLGMALDEPGDKDEVFDNYDINEEYGIESEVLEILCPECDEDISELFESYYPFKLKEGVELTVHYV